MKPYSVLLLYPDYVANDFGSDTFYDFVKAKSVEDAIAKARKRCIKTNNLSLNDEEDLHVLLVTEGHNEGL